MRDNCMSEEIETPRVQLLDTILLWPYTDKQDAQDPNTDQERLR